MSSSANVANIAAVRAVRQALRLFVEEVNSALITLDLEARRPIEWIEHDRTQYWPREMRKASDWVSEARLALQRCELTIDADHRKTCYDEKKQLEKAKRRLHLSEDKIRAVKRWRLEVRKEVEEFQVQVAKLQRYLETDFERAIALLDRMAQSLEKYIEVSAPASGGSGSIASSNNSSGAATAAGDSP